ncbi:MULTISPECIES: hypothetical protein [Paenibacillus]|uniref:Uncharacterized protein n=1 Tax=Paenibacillus lactis TaxID=228574 RepID=A0ABS4FD58_9BACL|nr:hypothetical protein [Paenibacillus lactis]MBP1893987.1 hypothetical protein [Paenibacillus lactis]GIO90111.1 hypothetical protein J31TS3_13380 [Paenibacillus lactis]
MNMDEKLFRYYLELKSPEAGEWNSSPPCLYTEVVTRDYVRKSFKPTEVFRYAMLELVLGIGMITLDTGLKEKEY